MSKQLANAQDLVEVESIRDSAVLLKDGRVLKVIMVSGLSFSLKSEREQSIITYAYQNFLNALDFSIQILIHSRKINIENYLSRLSEQEREEPSELLKNQIVEYREFVRSFVGENPIMAKTFFVVVPFVSIIALEKEKMTRFFPLFKKKDASEESARATEAREEHEANFRHTLSQLDQRVNQVMEGLFNIGLEAEPLGDEALIELFYNFYNPETVERGRIHAAEKTHTDKE